MQQIQHSFASNTRHRPVHFSEGLNRVSFLQKLKPSIARGLQISIRAMLPMKEYLSSPHRGTIDLAKLSTHKQDLIKQALDELPTFNRNQLEALISIMKLTGCSKNGAQSIVSIQDAISWINQELQLHCLRARGAERQEVTTPQHLEAQRPQLLKALQELGHINEISPQQHKYKSVWVLGANDESMTQRFQQAADDLERYGIEIKENSIVIRTGERPLWPYVEYSENGIQLQSGEKSTLPLVARLNGIDEQVLQNLVEKHITPTVLRSQNPALLNEARAQLLADLQNIKADAYWPTEVDLARDIFIRLQTQYSSLAELQLQYVVAPQKPDGSRPTTEDVERAAAQTAPIVGQASESPAEILVYSNQPHILRQALVLKNVAQETGQNCTIETVGPKEDPQSLNIAVALDELARRFYEAKKFCSAK